MAESLSLQQARRLCIHAQGLDGDWIILPGWQAVTRTVARLGYVQIDTIAIVERAHNHTLWRRQPEYAAGDLHAAQAVERTIFEALYPNASFLPVQHYRYALPSMRANADWWETNWRASSREERDAVLARIRAEGPLGASDFDAPPGFKREGWWSWKPAKRTLEHLFVTGELMVSERRGFERVFDLRERVLPATIATTYPTDDELARFLAELALAGMGIAGAGNGRWRAGLHRTLLGQGLVQLAEEGLAVPVQIEGIDKGAWYAHADTLSAADDPPPASRAQILSPFDSLIINRAWVKSVWGFDYSIECYLPQARRRYGYFCLPVLWNDRFVARADAKADRTASTLQVIRLILEPGVELEEAFPPALAGALWDLAGFCGCTAVTVQAVEPEGLREALVAAVERGGQESRTSMDRAAEYRGDRSGEAEG
jgi:uncharacterized protein YcaQ